VPDTLSRSEDRGNILIKATTAKVAIFVLVLASMAWFGYFAKPLLLKHPPVSVDEALFANPAISLLHHGTMSTDLLRGTMPGIGQHTYWTPPLYFLYLAAVFRIAGPSLVSLRLATTATALAVLFLTYLLSIRTGLSRRMALLPVCLVAVDAMFLRGALVGRMDMLTLCFILLALWMATRSFAPWNSFVTGVTCAIALLTHPAGIVAPIAVIAFYLLSAESRRLRSFVPLMAGILIPFLPWLIYISFAPRDFLAQFGGQLARKAKGHNLHDSFVSFFFYLIGQYANDGGPITDILWVLPLWIVGLAGLGDAARLASSQDRSRARSLYLIYGSQILIIALILWSGQVWYIVYVIPITAIGVIHFLNNTLSPPRGISGMALAFLVLCCVGGFVVMNLRHTARVNYRQNILYRPEFDYPQWSSEVSRKTPPGSTVLLCLTPDLYFGLKDRQDLTLREYLPPNIPIGHDAYWSYLSQADYVIVGKGSQSPSADVEDFLRSKGTLIDTVGNEEHGYFARIYRVTR
jgi:4-amino-4-deoxy-L-arabinose transferase-like glycosyltransferase